MARPIPLLDPVTTATCFVKLATKPRSCPATAFCGVSPRALWPGGQKRRERGRPSVSHSREPTCGRGAALAVDEHHGGSAAHPVRARDGAALVEQDVEGKVALLDPGRHHGAGLPEVDRQDREPWSRSSRWIVSMSRASPGCSRGTRSPRSRAYEVTLLALEVHVLAGKVRQGDGRGRARQGSDSEIAHEGGDIRGLRGHGGASEPEACHRERGAEGGAPDALPAGAVAFPHERLHPGHERAQRAPRSRMRR